MKLLNKIKMLLCKHELEKVKILEQNHDVLAQYVCKKCGKSVTVKVY